MSLVDEQVALSAGMAVAILPGDVVQIEGEPRLEWLTTLSSQVFRGLSAGESREGLLLDAQGRIKFSFGAVEDGQKTWLLTAPGEGKKLAEFLDSMRFMTPVKVRFQPEQQVLAWLETRNREDESRTNSENGETGQNRKETGEIRKIVRQLQTEISGSKQPHLALAETDEAGFNSPESSSKNPLPDQLTVAAQDEPANPAGVEAEPGPIWEDPWPGVTTGGTGYSDPKLDGRRHPGGTAVACYWPVPQAQAFQLAKRIVQDLAQQAELPLLTEDGYRVASALLAGTEAWQGLRIAAWRPTIAEVDGRTLPHELDWLRTAIHLEKGCYCGQETVARIVNLGKPPRRLVYLALDGAANLIPPPGAQIRCGTRVLGQVTSVGQHYAEGLVGLGVIKRAARLEADQKAPSPAGQVQITWLVGDEGEAEPGRESLSGQPEKIVAQPGKQDQLGPETGDETGGASGSSSEIEKERVQINAQVIPIVSPEGVSWAGQAQIDRRQFSRLPGSTPGGKPSGLMLS